MASFNNYPGNGTNKNFVVTFPYLDKSHVRVLINGVETTAWSWFDSSTIQLTTAPPNGSSVSIQRKTPVAERLAAFTNGEALLDEELNTATGQSLYAAEEAIDGAAEAVSTAAAATGIAQDALDTATDAVTTANSAVATATDAMTTADDAVDIANAASDVANGASDVATGALTTANNAVAAAQDAADAAQDLADTVAIHTAADLPFESATSGVPADNVQEAIDLIAQATGVVTPNSDNVTNSSSVSGASVSDALDSLDVAKAALEHTHDMADIVGLSDALDEKADITSVAEALATKVPNSRQVATSGLASGGGALDADQTITVPKAAASDLYPGNEDGKATTPKQLVLSLAPVDLGNKSGNITLDFTAFINANMVLTANATLKFPSVDLTPIIGRSGLIEVAENATGGYTLGFDVPGTSGFIFDGGTAISIDTTANRVTKIGYFIRSATRIELYQTGKGVR